MKLNAAKVESAAMGVTRAIQLKRAAQRKVIDAAKAYRAGSVSLEWRRLAVDLDDAVDALLEAERAEITAREELSAILSGDA